MGASKHLHSARPSALDEVLGCDTRLLMIVGGFGCGKTEVSVNLALQLARRGRRVQIADLDLVNPYFRCREARELMERHGVRVVAPPGAQAWADLPIMLPEISGMLNPGGNTLSLFDVGGDDVGARVLACLRPMIAEGSYELWQVVNAKRPFSETVERCVEMYAAIEGASRLRITGLLINSHLVEETTPKTVLEGWSLGCKLSARLSLPVRCVAVMDELADDPALAEIDAPLLRLKRHMLPPWFGPVPDPASDVQDEGVNDG